jgi:hypothetical protein
VFSAKGGGTVGIGGNVGRVAQPVMTAIKDVVVINRVQYLESNVFFIQCSVCIINACFVRAIRQKKWSDAPIFG